MFRSAHVIKVFEFILRKTQPPHYAEFESCFFVFKRGNLTFGSAFGNIPQM